MSFFYSKEPSEGSGNIYDLLSIPQLHVQF